MAKNKLYNQSYFVKRILDAGFDVTRLNITFEKDDARRWMVIINSKKIPYKFNICVTCFKVDDEFNFKFQGQGLRDFTLNTLSMTPIIKILNNVISEKEDIWLNALKESQKAAEETSEVFDGQE